MHKYINNVNLGCNKCWEGHILGAVMESDWGLGYYFRVGGLFRGGDN